MLISNFMTGLLKVFLGFKSCLFVDTLLFCLGNCFGLLFPTKFGNFFQSFGYTGQCPSMIDYLILKKMCIGKHSSLSCPVGDTEKKVL
jgi:hypothetical protein